MRYDREDPQWWTTARGAQPGAGAVADGLVLMVLGLGVALLALDVVDLVTSVVR